MYPGSTYWPAELAEKTPRPQRGVGQFECEPCGVRWQGRAGHCWECGQFGKKLRNWETSPATIRSDNDAAERCVQPGPAPGAMP